MLWLTDLLFHDVGLYIYRSDPLHESPHLTARGGGGGGSGGQEGGGQVEKDRYEEFLSVEWKPNYER